MLALAGRMLGSKAFEIRTGPCQRGLRIRGESTGDGCVEPQRSALIASQSPAGVDPLGERFDLGTVQASLGRAALEPQQPLIAEVDHMLPRRSEDGSRFAGSDQIVVAHETRIPQKHKKHKPLDR